MKACSIEGCGKPQKARGWCGAHWWRWSKHGDPLGEHPRDDKARFMSKVNKTDGCWIWAAYKNPAGYGMFALNNRPHIASRVAWSLFVGEVPDGLFIDHRCRNRACVRPDHLRLVTTKENSEHIDIRSDNNSGYRGVFWDKVRMKWCASAKHHGRVHYGGFFDDVHEAGKAAQDLRNNLFTHNDLDRNAV